jgi:hypothetical protein
MRLSWTAPRPHFGAIALILLLARPAHGQDDRAGRVDGRVTDSTHARPLAGARVVAASTDQRAAVISRATSTDSAGRYSIDSLPAGRYAVGIESPLLDSLEIALSPREVVVAAGQRATIDLALPPATKLRAALCPGVTLPPQTGVMIGHVVDAESESPLPNAVLALSWRERDVDRTTLKPVSRERTAAATTDSSGWYRLCGVPTDTWLSMQLQHMGRSGPVIRTLVGDTLGIAVRYLSFDAASSRPASDSAAPASPSAADGVAPPLLSGTAMLSGVVRGTGDLPLASAEVRVRGARGTSKTDALGRYSLSGLPAGTQVLDVRRVGYGAAELPVELRSGVMVTSDARLQRIVNLDSIRVVATIPRYKEFNAARKNSLSGVFIGPEELVWRSRVSYASEMFGSIPGYRIYGDGREAQVINGRGTAMNPCKPNVVIDGMEHMSVNDIVPMDIGAIAAYRLGEQVPGEYDEGCGAILIWTKR